MAINILYGLNMQGHNLNNSSFCRTCNTYCPIGFPLDSSNLVFGVKTLKRYIEDTLNLEVSTEDNLPSIICLTCYSLLEKLYQFQCQFQKVDKELHKIRNNKEKEKSPKSEEESANQNVAQISVEELIINDADKEESEYLEVECKEQIEIIQEANNTSREVLNVLKTKNKSNSLNEIEYSLTQPIDLRTKVHNGAGELQTSNLISSSTEKYEDECKLCDHKVENLSTSRQFELQNFRKNALQKIKTKKTHMLQTIYSSSNCQKSKFKMQLRTRNK